MNKLEYYFLNKLENGENKVRNLWCNPNVSLIFIENNFDKVNDWYRVSQNPNLTEEFIEKYLDKNWSWSCIFSKFSLEFIEKHLDKARICWFYNVNVTYSRKKLTPEFVERHINENWNWEDLMQVQIISDKILEKFFEKSKNEKNLMYNRFSYRFEKLENYDKLSLKFIEEHLEFQNWNWNWGLIAKHSEINFNFINNYKEKWCKSDWNYFFENKYSLLPVDTINENPNLDWDWKQISKLLPYFGWKLIINHSHKNWDWNLISQTAQMGFIEKYLYLPWNWCFVSRNSNLTFEFIEQHLDIEWDWLYMGKLKDC
jgi:hypothetical protein